MSGSGSQSASSQAQRVLKHFNAHAGNWEEIYGDATVRGAVIKSRHALALQWIRELQLQANARVLEVGCGAGFLSISLVELGYAVDALDASERMVELARKHAGQLGTNRMRVRLGDAHALEYGDEVFSLVIALGVLPWLHSPEVALREMARVIAPAGVLIVSSDNRLALHRILDPRFTPVLEPINLWIKRCLERQGLWWDEQALDARGHTPAAIDRIASEAGLTKIRGQTLGFGPFSLAGRVALPDSVGLRIHRRLQSMAERGTPVIRSGGHQYMLLARKRSPARHQMPAEAAS
jgi:2-polyprenyl-3-methyl-5-hydroxy-6-metoxy-1,4-benzoquinol methylase